MLSNAFKNIIGFLWALPITLVGFVYALLLRALGWYEWCGIYNWCFVWCLDEERVPAFFKKWWSTWGGHCVGCVIVLHDYPQFTTDTTLRHEQEHAAQCMRLGVFQPILYALILFVMMVLKNVDSYRCHPMEIDARVAAGQQVLPVDKK